MSPETVFSLANAAVLPAWLALAASPPGAPWTRWTWLIAGRVLPLALAVPYALLLAWHWPAGGGYGSLAAVRTLLEAPGALVAGWLHYLAFDLFVGTWIARRAGELGVPHVVVLPVLALTFLFGPVGLLAFFALRAVRRIPAFQPTSGVSR